MPQASERLREAVGHYDTITAEGRCLNLLLEAGFTEKNGVLHSPKNLRWTKAIDDAVCYLCDEWDYAYYGTIPEVPTNPSE